MAWSSYGFTGFRAGTVGTDAIWESEVDIHSLCAVDVLSIGLVFCLELPGADSD